MNSLAKSIIIHSKTVAFASAIANIEHYPNIIDLDDKETFPYYRNLAGLPAPYNSASVIVTSLDTNNDIDILTTNMLEHPITLLSFKNNERVFQDVINNYPDDVLYVIGRLFNLGTLAELTEKEDGDIVYYDDRFISSREVDLIQRLEIIVKKHLDEYDNPLFIEVDDLYCQMLQYALYTLIDINIPQIRKSNIESRQVSDFDLESRFNSFYFIGDSGMILNDNVRLWLYHNLPYLSENIGTEEVYRSLLENVVYKSGNKIVTTELVSRAPANSGAMYRIPNYGQAIYDLVDDGLEETNYYSIMRNKNPTISNIAPKYNKEMELFKTQMHHPEHTRYIKVVSDDIEYKVHQREDDIIMELTIKLLLLDNIYSIDMNNGISYSKTGTQFLPLFIGLLLRTMRQSIDIDLTTFKYLNLLNPIVDPDDIKKNNGYYYDDVILDDFIDEYQYIWASTPVPLTGEDMLNLQLSLWFCIEKHIAIHNQPNYRALMEVVTQRLTYSPPINLDFNVKQSLYDNNIDMPDDKYINDILVSLVNNVMDMDTTELFKKRLITEAITRILNILTSYTVEAMSENTNVTKIKVDSALSGIGEGLKALEIDTSILNCRGVQPTSFIIDKLTPFKGGYYTHKEIIIEDTTPSDILQPIRLSLVSDFNIIQTTNKTKLIIN